jgi:hypothetical protein
MNSERTLLEACDVGKLPYPVSEADLDATFAKLDELGIAHNLLDEPCYRLSKVRRAGARKNPWDVDELRQKLCVARAQEGGAA